MGVKEQFIELSGLPTSAMFLSNSHDPYQFNISWSVDSCTPVDEFMLYFRELWSNETISTGKRYINKTLSELTPDNGGRSGRSGVGGSEWRHVIVHVKSQERLSQYVSFVFQGLEQ